MATVSRPGGGQPRKPARRSPRSFVGRYCPSCERRTCGSHTRDGCGWCHSAGLMGDREGPSLARPPGRLLAGAGAPARRQGRANAVPPLKPPGRPLRLTSVRVLVFMVAVIWAACALSACGTERQATASHPAASAANTATPQARTPVPLTAASNGTTVRLFRGQSVSVMLRGTALSWHVPVATGRAVRRTSASGGYPGHQPARATFLATWPGRAVLSSVNDTACLHARPSCAIAQRSWRVVVLVTGPHS